MGILGLVVLLLLLLFLLTPGPGPYPAVYAPRYGWGGPSLVGLLLVVLLFLCLFRAVPWLWYGP